MREVAKITSQACDNFLKNYRQRHPKICDDHLNDEVPSSWHSKKSDIKSELAESNESKDKDDDLVDACNTDMCCPKKRKKKNACCPQKPACPKKRKPRSCAQKPACPKKRKKRSCAKKRPSCPKKRKAACKKKPACPRKRKPSCPKKRIKCSKPGPIMNNGYLNFVRSFRRKHCGLKPQELIQMAARAWCSLPEEKKDRYRRV